MNNSMNNINGKIDRNTYKNASPINFNVGDGVIGSYDNIKLKTQCANGIDKPPCNPPIKSNLMFLPQGTPLPLKNEMIYSELPTNSMYIFANSYASPDCCPSTFSTDRGCICTSDTQRTYLGASRGYNKTYENYGF
jgi:hypothetical protein